MIPMLPKLTCSPTSSYVSRTLLSTVCKWLVDPFIQQILDIFCVQKNVVGFEGLQSRAGHRLSCVVLPYSRDAMLQAEEAGQCELRAVETIVAQGGSVGASLFLTGEVVMGMGELVLDLDLRGGMGF